MPDTITALRRILRDCRTIAVVGVSPDWHRPSHFAAKYLQAHGYRIIPVNPRCDEVLGERCYPSLLEVPDAIDMVDVFRRPDQLHLHTAELIAAKPRVVWYQLGIRNDVEAAKLEAAGIEVVQDRCTLADHRRLKVGAPKRE